MQHYNIINTVEYRKGPGILCSINLYIQVDIIYISIYIYFPSSEREKDILKIRSKKLKFEFVFYYRPHLNVRNNNTISSKFNTLQMSMMIYIEGHDRRYSRTTEL